MQSEYGAESRLEPAAWKIIRWVDSDSGPVEDTLLPTGARLAADSTGKTVILFENQWSCDFFAERNPKIQLSALPEPQPDDAEAVRTV